MSGHELATEGSFFGKLLAINGHFLAMYWALGGWRLAAIWPLLAIAGTAFMGHIFSYFR